MMKLWFLASLVLISFKSTAFAADPDPFLADSATTPATDTPAPSLGKATPPTDSPAPVPEAQPPVPITSIPGKTAKAPAPAPAAPKKDIYEQYYDYLDHEKEQQVSENDYSQRNLFPHENGGWQVGLTYHYKAFSGYDFSRQRAGYAPLFADSSGPGIQILAFPIKSLSFGRLGFGPTFAYYWSNFTIADADGGTFSDKPPGGLIYTYGVKAVYEFDYWLGQFFVPHVFLGYDQVFVKGYTSQVRGQISGTRHQADFPSFRTTNQSYGAGFHLNLNRVEPVVASRALVNVGIRKFYLTYAATQRVGEFSGLTHSLGLSFEF